MKVIRIHQKRGVKIKGQADDPFESGGMSNEELKSSRSCRPRKKHGSSSCKETIRFCSPTAVSGGWKALQGLWLEREFFILEKKSIREHQMHVCGSFGWN